MREAAGIYLRGFLIVFLTSMNVGQIAGGHYVGAGIVGFLISFVWWTNAFKANNHTVPHAACLYGLGAGTGTILGMVAARLFYSGHL